MAERVRFPDVTLIACSGIADGLNAMGVAATVEPWVPFGVRTNLAPPLVTVMRTGGLVRQIVFEDAEVAVEAWGDSHEAAADLCEAALTALRAMQGTVVDGVPVYVVADVAGPANLPDPDSGVPRYTASVSLTVRGTTAST